MYHNQLKMKAPTLYQLAANRTYDSIPSHIQDSPLDILWSDHQGCTPLHLLCQARDVDRSLLTAVESIVKESPSCIAFRNHSTLTPMHYAAEKRLVWGGGEHHGATELLLMLLRYCPDAVVMRTESGMKPGKTPFHISVEANADIQVLRAMLMIYPGLATEPFVKKDVYSVAENPLQILWNNHKINSLTRRHDNTYEKMALLLRAAHYGTVQDTSETAAGEIRLLCAACSVRCPQEYFLHILSQHELQVRQFDDRNLLPLHYAVRNASVDSQPYSQFVLESLLERYPAAASFPDNEGRLPLHVALMDSMLTWHKGGIQKLVYAYPAALRVMDPLHKLFPFLISAVHAIKSMLHLSTTFELLRAAPDVIESLVVCR
jgi:hypothetical protein